jgi:hypothetical protein
LIRDGLSVHRQAVLGARNEASHGKDCKNFYNRNAGNSIFAKNAAEIAVPYPLSALTLKMGLISCHEGGEPTRNVDGFTDEGIKKRLRPASVALK